ncbi:hypothetical protein [Brevibacillus sp. DP1.3A]|uniref:hypothetical protein n=1 Tax=Brevibacillus sp. DP1.3A TaxID=2738867 RepID=UPI00156B2DB0|nr:hypothetical protein [Brevibacillus sp. DP1.3A]UED76076.1 hypothetical protein HP399_006165 [Brevibacillus sp. DP1.3A]
MTLEEKISGVKYELESLKNELDHRFNNPADILNAFADFYKKLDGMITDMTVIEESVEEIEYQLEQHQKVKDSAATESQESIIHESGSSSIAFQSQEIKGG